MRSLVKISFLFALLITFSDLHAQNANVENAIQLLHTRYLEFRTEWNNNGNIETAIGNLRNTYDGLEPALKEEVKDKLLSSLISTFENKSNDAFLEESNEVLTILPRGDESVLDIYSIVADIYAKRGNREMLGHTIGMMRSEPLSGREDYAKLISEYNEKYNSLQPLEKYLEGWWVSDYHRYSTKGYGNWPSIVIYNGYYYGQPSISLDRRSHLLYKGEYGIYFCNQPKLGGSYPLYYDYEKHLFKTVMISGRVHQGNQALANQYLSSAQHTKAEFSALARDSRATLGQTATASAIGALSASGYEALAMNAATSRINEDVLNIVGTPLNENTLSAHIVFQQQSMMSYYYAPNSFVIFDTDTQFYRWRKEDGIVFGDKDCRPISPFVSKLTPDMELYRIKKETNLWNSGYWKRSLLHLAITGAMAGLGIWNIKTAMHKEGSVTGNIILGSICLTGVCVYPTIALSSVSNKRAEYRTKKVNEYNDEQLGKLRQLSK